MLGKKQNKEKVVIVTTKQDLDAAVKRKEPNIEVQGDMVKKIKWMKGLSKAQIVALVTLLASAVIPSPASPVSAVASVSALTAITGKEAALIIFSSGLSISMVLSVLKGYDVTIGNGDKSVLLTKK